MLHVTKIKPLHNYLLVSGDRYEKDIKSNGIIMYNKGELKMYQEVLEVGPMVQGIKVGDKVSLNLFKYAEMKYDKNSLQNDMDNNKVIKWHLPWQTIYDENDSPKDCLLIDDHCVVFVYEGKEVEENIILPQPKKFELN